MLNYPTTKDIREEFKSLLAQGKFTSVNREAGMTSLMGSRTIEIVGSTFIADEESIFGEVNRDYIKREEEWYDSMSLNVNDIPGGAPAVWKSVADKDGYINSNYGWCIYSPENGFLGSGNRPIRGDEASQYLQVVQELCKNPESRRATMIYTRPTMWLDYNRNGRSDFMCTNSVQYVIRDDKIHAIVSMRSNDSVFGFKNDRAWQAHVLEKVANEVGYEVGNIYWQTGSLHVYERHFHLVDPINYKQKV